MKGEYKMGKRIFLITGLLLLTFTGVATAAEKYGFIDMREIATNSDPGKKANQEFKKIYDKNRVIIQGRESELQKMKEELDKQRSILTESALREKESTFQGKFREYQSLLKEANDEVQAKNLELEKSIFMEIQKIANAIGEKEKYTAIFDIGALPWIFYSKANANDLTKRVMEEFNRTYKPKTK